MPLRVHLPGLRFLAWSFFCPCMHACPRTHARTRICTRVRVRAAYPSRAHARAPTRIGTGTQAGVSKAGMHGGARAGRQAHARAGSCERASERVRLHGHPRMHARAGMRSSCARRHAWCVGMCAHAVRAMCMHNTVPCILQCVALIKPARQAGDWHGVSSSAGLHRLQM